MSKLREALHQAAELIADAIEENGASDWIDQDASPLGRRKHCALVRSGVLKGSREGRRVLVRRAELDAYLDRRVWSCSADTALEHDVAKILSDAGSKRRRSA